MTRPSPAARLSACLPAACLPGSRFSFCIFERRDRYQITSESGGSPAYRHSRPPLGSGLSGRGRWQAAAPAAHNFSILEIAQDTSGATTTPTAAAATAATNATMGVCHSAIDDRFEKAAANLGPFLDKLGMDDKEAKQLYKVFEKVDTDLAGGVSLDECVMLLMKNAAHSIVRSFARSLVQFTRGKCDEPTRSVCAIGPTPVRSIARAACVAAKAAPIAANAVTHGHYLEPLPQPHHRHPRHIHTTATTTPPPPSPHPHHRHNHTTATLAAFIPPPQPHNRHPRHIHPHHRHNHTTATLASAGAPARVPRAHTRKRTHTRTHAHTHTRTHTLTHVHTRTRSQM